jgi:mitochondrial import receptor subunit TOM20
MASSIRTTTVIAACVGTAVTGFVAYAIYFDHRRRTDPEFRKALKRDARRYEREVKEAAEREGAQRKKAIRDAVEQAKAEGFPTNPEEIDEYFLYEVNQGEIMCKDGK